MKHLILPLALAAALVPTAAQARTLGTLAFHDCDLVSPGSGASLRAECATLEVPEDPTRPDGRRIALKVGLVASRASEPAADPVLFIAGGPGQSATESYAGIAGGFARLREKRHILFVDQRGTGGSNRLACAFPDELSESLSEPEQQKQMARDCLEGFDADVAQYTTSVAVTDLEALRIAIGAPALNVYGGSYGTRVAQEYARQFPDSVRSLMLDGVVPPDLALGSEHSLNLESALRASLERRCGDDAACREAFGNPFETLYALRDRVRAQPRTLQARDPRTWAARELRFDEAALVAIARLFAYTPETTALMPWLLDEAAKGRPEPLVQQATIVYDALVGQINHGMQLSVICAEDAPRLADRPEDKDLILGNAITGVTLNQCEVWPKGPVSPGFHALLRNDIPTLLMSGELDPVTPPRYGEHVLAALGKARHLVGKGQGHILLGRGCVPKLAARFVETLDPAGLDTSCLDALGPTPFFLTANGAAP